MNLPRYALSVRQPWAHAIIHCGKDMENRSWKRWMKDWKFRGRIAIHASSGMTEAEYWDGAETINGINFRSCPSPDKLIRGAIIGTVEIIDNVWERSNPSSPWFFGPGALVLANPEPCLPIAAGGKLGLFQWQPGGELRGPARWMMPKPEPML